MQKNIFRKGTAAFLSAGICLTASLSMPNLLLTANAQETVIANPFIWSDVPDDDVIRVGDTYYMVSTTMFFSPGAPIMKSKDLVSWEICNYVYDTYADGDKQNLIGGEHDYAHGQWAASLRYKDGVFYVFFGSYGTGKSYIYKTTDIEHGTWSRTELNGMYHDASILFDDDGRNYLVYGGGGEIKIKEFNSEMTDFKWGGADQTLLKTGLDNLAGEGSHIQKIGDYYYIFLIAWPSTSGRIELCYRSKSLLGTYEGKTVLNSGLGTYGSGVAQGGIVDTPSGEWYGVLFQDHGSVGRIPVLVPVTWQDGWPMMGINGKAPTSLTIDTDYTGTSLTRDDDFSYSSDKLALEWQWNHNPDNNAWSVTERDGWLRLHNEHIAQSILHARKTLTMRTEGPSCTSIIKLDTSHMKEGDCAGLSAFQFNYGNVGVYHGGNAKYIYMAKNAAYGGTSSVMDSKDDVVESVPMQGDTIYLKEEFVFNTVDENFNVSNNIDKVNFFYSYDGTNWTKIGDTLSMTYDLKLFTGYRSAVYSYPTKSTGGWADIDFFDYERAEWNVPQIIEPDADGYYFHDTFEGTLSDWSGRGAAKVQTSGRTALDGSEALLVSDRTAAWNGAIKKLGSAFKSGESYSFSANVLYLEGNPSDTFYMKLQYDGADGEAHYDTIASANAPIGKWVQLANPDFTIPEGAKNVCIYLETAETTDNFYIDEIIGAVSGTAIASTASSGEILRGDVNGDKIINIYDLILAKRYLIQGIASDAADVNQNGTLDVSDIIQIQKYLLGQIAGFSTDTTITPVPTPTEPSETNTKDYMNSIKSSITASVPASATASVAGRDYGKVIPITYYSSIAKKNKSANVLLPAGYNENETYPVLYVNHGIFGDQNSMLDDGMKIQTMAGNLAASGEAEKMIIVFTAMYTSQNSDVCSGFTVEETQKYDAFREDLTECLMPYINEHYSTKTGRKYTGISGFSMGGRETLYIGVTRPEYFGYIGAACPAPGVTPGADNLMSHPGNMQESEFKISDAANQPYMLFIAGGTNDGVVNPFPENYHNILTANNQEHLWLEVAGGGHDGSTVVPMFYNLLKNIFKA